MTLEEYSTNIAYGFSDLTDITKQSIYKSRSIVFDVKGITKFKRIPTEYQQIPWASKVDNRATGLQVYTYDSKEELFLNKPQSDGYFNGYLISVGSLMKIENDLIDECFAKSCLLVSETNVDYTLKISRKATETLQVFSNGRYVNSSNTYIEIMALKLTEEFEFLPISSRLKSKERG